MGSTFYYSASAGRFNTGNHAFSGLGQFVGGIAVVVFVAASPIAFHYDVVRFAFSLVLPNWRLVRSHRSYLIGLDKGFTPIYLTTNMADLPDFDALWDYDHPADTESKFRALVPLARESDNVPYYAELLTQIARTEGLQHKFEEAHATLDVVNTLLANSLTHSRAYARYLLERGRVLNSSKHPDQARPFFIEAWNLANTLNEDALAVDAAHMVAIVESPEAQLEWNHKALALAESSAISGARKWLGSLYNNLGWTHHDAGRYAEALDLFERGVRFREEQKQVEPLRVAKWCVARCLRALGRVEEALMKQQTILGESGAESDGYIHEEIGECLLALNKADEAKSYFAQAYTLLSQDPWLVENEAGRLARLKELSNA